MSRDSHASHTHPVTVQPTALQLVHGYNEPFLSLTALYSRALRQQGWRVITVYLTGQPDTAIMAKSCADVVLFLNASTADLRGLKLQLAWRLRGLLRQYAVTLLVAQRYKPVYLGLLASLAMPVRVLGVGHAFGVMDNLGRQLFLRCFSHRLTLAGVSQAVTDDMQQHAGSLRCLCLHNAIDTAALEPQLQTRALARATLGLTDQAFVFANVGRLHADKDQGTLIRAFALIANDYPDATLLLIGQGRCEAAYRTLIQSLQLDNRVVLTGPVPAAATLFRAFDAYVSASDREPFGIVLAEAMLARLPVISTDCGGAPEVLGNTALYFSRGDHQALASQMRTLLQATPAERTQRGQALYDRLQTQFTFDCFAEHLQRLVRDNLTGGHHADA